ncbi:MAG: phosphoribosylaminoimidazolesuccinocarboxamide synthase [Solirubrobacteraceae bacterium]|nr:phosphoribosylaminoimidazolesuccinocarboxamide synthase [Solirubrobacteraceae bacterium]
MSHLSDLPLLARGKVREIYDLGDRLLLVASDRVSTYDVVHPNTVPGKGAVLTGLSAFWFDRTTHLVSNHVVSYTDGVPDEARGRGVVVRKLDMLPIEAIVRGHITGSGWKDYQQTGRVSGIELPAALQESQQLPVPIFTPSTKAEQGLHDEAIDFARSVELLEPVAAGTDLFDSGERLATRVREVSVALYEFARDHARERGVILADTKFEFGLDPTTGELVLGDEALTPDSSRYWPADGFEVGSTPPSFDKQFVRDWAVSSGWDKTPPAPEIPADVVAGTQNRYEEAYERITGEPLSAWLERTSA